MGVGWYQVLLINVLHYQIYYRYKSEIRTLNVKRRCNAAPYFKPYKIYIGQRRVAVDFRLTCKGVLVQTAGTYRHGSGEPPLVALSIGAS
jgi:hypothetical protein